MVLVVVLDGSRDKILLIL